MPKTLLTANVGDGAPIDHPDLPFTIQVHRWMENSQLRKAGGRRQRTRPRPASASRQVADADAAGHRRRRRRATRSTSHPPTSSCSPRRPASRSARISCRNGSSTTSSGSSTSRSKSTATRTIIALRFKRIYHPFTVTLKDFRFDRYAGTDKRQELFVARRVQGPEHNVDREVLIWMNNPLRYAGTTFYQLELTITIDRSKGTVLQVVTNPSWMTPYVGCMLVAIGMLAHFGTMLVRFLRRRAEDADQLDSTERA